MTLRHLLWLRHGCPSAALYGDDGEMQCSVCLIDFKRLPATAIADRFERLGRAQLVAAAPLPAAGPAPEAGW